MQIRIWDKMSARERDVLTRKQYTYEKGVRSTRRGVARIINRVRKDGDKALRYYSWKYNRYRLPSKQPSFRDALLVSDAERHQAAKQLRDEVRTALDLAIERAQAVQSMEENACADSAKRSTSDRNGVRVTQHRHPIGSAGLYVPRGRGCFPSMMVMQGVPAVIAHVPRIVVVTPPYADGSVDPATLYVANILGIREIYRIGGVHGISALAFGTDTISPVDKIFGPGSKYVTIARQLLTSVVDCGMPAGPSESMIIADEHADPRVTALDLMTEAEHGSDSMALLVSGNSTFIDKVSRIIETELSNITQPRCTYINTVLNGKFGGAIRCNNYDEAVEIANAIAPEHLKIDTKKPRLLASRIRTAGEILLGSMSAFSIANYLVGANSILPTNRNARSWSALSPADFCVRRAEIEVTQQGFDRLAAHTIALARYEQFPAHAHAIQARHDEES